MITTAASEPAARNRLSVSRPSMPGSQTSSSTQLKARFSRALRHSSPVATASTANPSSSITPRNVSRMPGSSSTMRIECIKTEVRNQRSEVSKQELVTHLSLVTCHLSPVTCHLSPVYPPVTQSQTARRVDSLLQRECGRHAPELCAAQWPGRGRSLRRASKSMVGTTFENQPVEFRARYQKLQKSKYSAPCQSA